MNPKTICNFPLQSKDAIKLEQSWIQTMPSGEIISEGNGTNGFAQPPNLHFPCRDGGWCDVACGEGKIETQYDDITTKPFVWEVRDPKTGEMKFVGGGRKAVEVNGTNIIAGGKNGLYCDKGRLTMNAPSNNIKEYANRVCIDTPRILKVINNSSHTVTFCRVTNNFGVPQIPTTFSPGEEKYLTTIPTCNDYSYASKHLPNTCFNSLHGKVKNQKRVWRNNAPQGCEDPIKNFLTYFIGRADEGAINTCMFNYKRPSTGQDSLKGLDMYPYVMTVSEDSKIKVNSNNDLLLGTPCSGYDRGLGNPKIGLRVYSSDKIIVGQVEYVGEYAPSDTDVLSNPTFVYPVIIEKGVISSDCKKMKQGIQVVAKNSSYNPVVIELYDVKSELVAELPKNICQTGICDFVSVNDDSEMERRTKERVFRTNNDFNLVKPRATSNSNKVLITVLVIVVIILVIGVIAFFVWLYLREKKKNKSGGGEENKEIEQLKEEIKTQEQLKLARNLGFTIDLPMENTTGGQPLADVYDTRVYNPRNPF